MTRRQEEFHQEKVGVVPAELFAIALYVGFASFFFNFFER
jgi:hypothetical protein